MKRCAAKALAVLTVLLATGSLVLAHPGMLAKDGCHNDNRAGERHWHVTGTAERAGACIQQDGATRHMTPCPVCEPETVEVVREVKHVNVQAFEAAMARVQADIRRALDRPPQIVEVEVEVPSLKPTTGECVGYRERFKANVGNWGRAAEDTASAAIRAGCW